MTKIRQLIAGLTPRDLLVALLFVISTTASATTAWVVRGNQQESTTGNVAQLAVRVASVEQHIVSLHDTDAKLDKTDAIANARWEAVSERLKKLEDAITRIELRQMGERVDLPR